MCFDFGAVKIQEGFTSLLYNSTLRPSVIINTKIPTAPPEIMEITFCHNSIPRPSEILNNCRRPYSGSLTSFSLVTLLVGGRLH